VAKYEGGERQLDVLKFLDFTCAAEAGPLKAMRILLNNRD
jgi:hypothetical protein